MNPYILFVGGSLCATIGLFWGLDFLKGAGITLWWISGAVLVEYLDKRT